MLQRKQKVNEARLLIVGFTFKENCADIRNTKVADLVRHLKEFAIDVTVYDPIADPDEAKHEYGIDVVGELPKEPLMWLCWLSITVRSSRDQRKTSLASVFWRLHLRHQICAAAGLEPCQALSQPRCNTQASSQ